MYPYLISINQLLFLQYKILLCSCIFNVLKQRKLHMHDEGGKGNIRVFWP